MTTIDFARSFLTFRIDTKKKPPQTVSHQPPYSLNNARIQLECRLQVTEKATDRIQTFVLGANCKTERVCVPRDVWTEPNADFVPIFSDTHFMNLKTYTRAGANVPLYPPGSGTQLERQVGRLTDAYDRTRVSIGKTDGEILTNAADIVAATLNNQRLNARTVIENDRYSAQIDYPVRTINANERNDVYQTDTGPILIPDLTCEPSDMLSHLELAFSAFNGPDWIELLVRVPTPVTENIDVYHYSRSLRFDADNAIIRLTDTQPC